METPRDLVALKVASFLQGEADRRHCRVSDLVQLRDEAFDLAITCFLLGESLPRDRPTPVGTWEEDRITEPHLYPFPFPDAKE